MRGLKEKSSPGENLEVACSVFLFFPVFFDGLFLLIHRRKMEKDLCMLHQAIRRIEEDIQTAG